MFFFLSIFVLDQKGIEPSFFFSYRLLDIGKYKLILGKASKDGCSGRGR